MIPFDIQSNPVDLSLFLPEIYNLNRFRCVCDPFVREDPKRVSEMTVYVDINVLVFLLDMNPSTIWRATLPYCRE